ncbi:hypothetical protein V6N13_028374 [Hibiscus sabdariffa]|uniref:Uncharacterized protein n=1 Tax=Hibiscus sabdariffa TaxID=183260 RepID=A0ABR2DAL5_9ROSI
MAKQALSDALSPEKPRGYASSTDNIAKLLKKWMRNPNPSRPGENIRCIEMSEIFEPLDCSNSDLSQSPDQASLFQDESKPDVNEVGHLSLLEK